MATRPLSAPAKKLAVSITATATSMTLNNIQDWNYAASTSNVFTSAASFNSSTSWPAVLKNDDGSQIEFVELDTTTLSGNTMDITKRGLSYVGGTTANAETAYAWNANETTINLGSNPPQLYEQYADKTNDESITGSWTIVSSAGWSFDEFPTKSGGTTPTSSSEFATKAYVDAAGISPSPYQANIISGNGSTSYSAGSVIYYSSSDQLWYPADADLTTSFQNKALGITQSTSNTSGDSINILLAGASTSVSTSLTAGTKYYLGNTTGSIATTGTYEVYLGYALSSTKFLFQPREDDQPFGYEKDALAGLAITTSAPSATNMYLTANDSTSAVVTNLIPRRNSTGDILVNETPQSSSAAASKGYVDTYIARDCGVYTFSATGNFTITHTLSQTPRMLIIGGSQNAGTTAPAQHSNGAALAINNQKCAWNAGGVSSSVGITTSYIMFFGSTSVGHGELISWSTSNFVISVLSAMNRPASTIWEIFS